MPEPEHSTASPLPVLHLLGNFVDPHTGAERELPDLAHALRGRRRCLLWSDLPPHPHYAAMGVRHVDPAVGAVPHGGMLLIGGVHVGVGQWPGAAAFTRVALRYNLPNHGRLFGLTAYLQHVTGRAVELLFVSKLLHAAVGLPGRIEYSLIPLAPFLSVPDRRPGEAFTLGRLSRDTLVKHHPDDVGLYRLLAAQGVRIRLMGATCLTPWLADVPGIELLPAGAEPAEAFLATLDTFFYRTGEFNEPYGRVVLEAMASGLPVVASALGGYAEQIRDGHSGLLIRSQDDALAAVLRLRGDAALRSTMAKEARRAAREAHGEEAIEAALRFYLR